MIVDTLKNRESYILSDNFKKAFEFLNATDCLTISSGRHEIDGDRVYANVVEYQTKDEGVFEAHRDYADIQFVVKGAEAMEYLNIANGKVKKEYSKEGDYALYEDSDKASRLVINAGEYAIFMPDDLHKPCLFAGNNRDVKKIIVKVKL